MHFVPIIRIMNYNKGKQFTVKKLKAYLNYIPDDVKVCIGFGDQIKPARYISNYNNNLTIESDIYMIDADENNLHTIISFQK